MSGRVALVTGAGRGLGLGIARALGREPGWTVVLADLVAERASEAADALAQEGLRADATGLDVTSSGSCRASVELVLARHRRLDVLVNNAGIADYGPAETTTQADWARVIDVLLTGTFLMSQAAYAALAASRSGAIVNIGSVGGMGGWPLRNAYGAAKAGVINLTQTLATEWAHAGIRVNCVSPGTIMTEMAAEAERRGVASLARYAARTPVGRMGAVEEIGAAVAFLASDRASFVTGANLRVDGGWVAWLNAAGHGYPETAG
jgi:NAD(P)-dependent dehydrogenase (short-subunit alcohol dehydrogenase family)